MSDVSGYPIRADKAPEHRCSGDFECCSLAFELHHYPHEIPWSTDTRRPRVIIVQKNRHKAQESRTSALWSLEETDNEPPQA